MLKIKPIKYPTENQEQIKLFEWINQHPILQPYCFHIPNEGKRSPHMGALLKRMGMRPGVSDVFVAYPSNGKHGLWLELKARNAAGKYNKPTVPQLQFIDDMRKMGYTAFVCNGAEQAIKAIQLYMVIGQ